VWTRQFSRAVVVLSSSYVINTAVVKKGKVKSFPSHKAHRASLISVSLGHGYGLVYRAAYLFTPQLSLVLTAPTHGGMARLS